jgi:hypothetical protein
VPQIDEFSEALGELREFARTTRAALDLMRLQQERHHKENKDAINELATTTSQAIGGVSDQVAKVEADVLKIKTARTLRKGMMIGGSAVIGFLGGTAGGPFGKAIAALVAKIGGTS